jgi:hypothetical protein
MFLGHPNSLAGEGFLAEWDFREGKGEIARDSSGNNRDAVLHGASWVKQGDGFAVSLDGVDDYVDCSPFQPPGVVGPISIEAWVKPTRKAEGEAPLLGEGMKSFLLTYYNTELLCWYIGHGDVANTISAQLKLDEWQHIAATFDGKRMTLWINGRQAASRESTVKTYETSGLFAMDTKPAPGVPKFKGLLDNVRVYNRALTEQEIAAHVKTEAAAHANEPAAEKRPEN